MKKHTVELSFKSKISECHGSCTVAAVVTMHLKFPF